MTLALVGLASGCGGGGAEEPAAPADSVTGESVGPPWFLETAIDSGIDFRHVSGASSDPSAPKRFPEIMGGGAALCDLDGDGDLDLYLVQSGRLEAGEGAAPGNRLYAGAGDGSFLDASTGSGAEDAGYGMGVAFGDVDGDGRGDLLVTNVGPNVLLRNVSGEGRPRFERSSLPGGRGASAWSTSAAMVDHDRDGDLDLFVCNYVDWSLAGEIECTTAAGLSDYCSPRSYDAPAADRLLRNDGGGSFEDVSAGAGILARRGNGLGVVCGDFDGDGLVDVFCANDQMENHLWHNEGDGTFVDVAPRMGCAVDQHGKPKAGMGTLAEDVDDDGDLDLLVVNLRAQSDSFFRNEGGFFVDDTARSGLASGSRPYTRFGVGWIDFDNDGWLDLYQANGRVAMFADSAPRSSDPYAEPNLLFAGGPGGRFRLVEPEGGVASALVHTSRAAAFGDVDGDGGVDVVVVNRDALPYLLRNVRDGRGRWIRFRVLEEHGRDALGAVLRIELEGRTLRRDVRSAFSYCAASDPRVHVGLGDATAVAAVRVTWPNGTEEVFGPFAGGELDRDHLLRFGEGQAR